MLISELNLSAKVKVVHLYDNLGNRLLSDYNTQYINLAHLSAGVYLVELINDDDSIIKKIVKE